MKMELIKETGHDGIWFMVYSDGTCVRATREEDVARAKFEECKTTLPKVLEVLETYEQP